MIITTKIDKQDLAVRGPVTVISAVQDDRYSRNLEIHLYQNGEAFMIPEGTTAIVSYKKSDGTGGNYDTLPDGTTAYEISNNVVTVALAPQVLTFPGRVSLAVGLLNEDIKLYTFVVVIDVQANPGLQATSDNYYKIIGALAEAGWEPNMFLGTDKDGKVIAKTGAGVGSTFYPTVDKDGNLSWTNDGGLDNPEPVNITGPQGERGPQGEQGPQGPQGEQGQDGATVEEVLAAMPVTTALDFSNLDNGTWTETMADGTVHNHQNTYDANGRPIAIDGITIGW